VAAFSPVQDESNRLLKNKFREGQATNILYALLLDYKFGSVSLVLPQPAQLRRLPGQCFSPQQLTGGLLSGAPASAFFSSLLKEALVSNPR
jgi:hypothetical protein